jgi:hypothetical protein
MPGSLKLKAENRLRKKLNHITTGGHRKYRPDICPPQVNAESGIPTDHPDTSHHLEIARGSDAKFLLVLI